MIKQKPNYWIDEKKATEYSEQQLQETLNQKGYKQNEINEALKDTFRSNQAISENKNKYHLLTILILTAIIITSLIIGALFFFNSKDMSIFSNNQSSSVILSESKENEQKSEKLNNETEDKNITETKLLACTALPDKLESCETFSCEEENSFTGTMAKKEISGMIDNKCLYTENTDGIITECRYPEELRKEVAEYERAMTNYKKREFKYTNDPKTGEPLSLEIIDGKEFNNPRTKAFEENICISKEQEIVGTCDELPNKLETCEPFSCQLEQMNIGKKYILKKSVSGLINGKCLYTEEMTEFGKINCEFSEDMRKRIAQQHRDNPEILTRIEVTGGQCIASN
jgi:hypothetical protein